MKYQHFFLVSLCVETDSPDPDSVSPEQLRDELDDILGCMDDPFEHEMSFEVVEANQ